MTQLSDWHSGGSHLDIGGHRIFVRTEGSGPDLTLLHGFPSSSWDWSKIAPLLAPHRRLVMLDFLGFGASAKPRQTYSIMEQADRVEAVWRHFGVTRTTILAHDYGDTVTEELLARQAERPLAARIERAMLLNGAVIGHLNHLLLIQKLLRLRGIGYVVSRFATFGLFARNFKTVFSPLHPLSDAELAQHWDAIALAGGNKLYDKLVHHYGDHERHTERWEGGLGRTDVPLHLVWGMGDPVSGADMIAYIREHVPRATIHELPEIRHYPQWEVPEVVAAQLLRFDTNEK